jgi:hypothetical protein
MGQPGQRFALPVLFLSAGQILLPCGIIAEEEHRRFREGLRQLGIPVLGARGAIAFARRLLGARDEAAV